MSEPIDRTEANKRAIDYLAGIIRTLPVVSERTLTVPNKDEAREMAETIWEALTRTAGVVAMTHQEWDNLESIGDRPMVIGQITDWEAINDHIKGLAKDKQKLAQRIIELENNLALLGEPDG